MLSVSRDLPQSATPRVLRSSRPDDLKRIKGIGVVIEKKLMSMGITQYSHIAQWTERDIEMVSQALDFRGRIERENWIEQARILAGGGQTDFSRRVDRGETPARN
jgi:predicted flap endonuclease-1-like 5' DNA nuclease